MIQVLQLKVTIGNLVMAMIEENSIESLVVAKVRSPFSTMSTRVHVRTRAYTVKSFSDLSRSLIGLAMKTFVDLAVGCDHFNSLVSGGR